LTPPRLPSFTCSHLLLRMVSALTAAFSKLLPFLGPVIFSSCVASPINMHSFYCFFVFLKCVFLYQFPLGSTVEIVAGKRLSCSPLLPLSPSPPAIHATSPPSTTTCPVPASTSGFLYADPLLGSDLCHPYLFCFYLQSCVSQLLLLLHALGLRTRIWRARRYTPPPLNCTFHF